MDGEKNTKKFEYIKTSFYHNQGLIELADTKANIILGINTILIPLIFGVTIVNIINLTEKKLLAQSYILNTFFVISLPFLFLSFIFSILVIKARLSEEMENFIFFKNIVKIDFKTYKKKIDSMNDDEIIEDYLKEIYTLAKINDIKYERYQCSLWMLIIGITSLIIGYFLIAVVNYYIIY